MEIDPSLIDAADQDVQTRPWLPFLSHLKAWTDFGDIAYRIKADQELERMSQRERDIESDYDE